MKRLIITMGVALALTSSACSKATTAGPGSTTTLPVIRPQTIASLVSTDNCGDLLTWIKGQANRQVTAYGLGNGGGGGVVRPMYSTEDKAMSADAGAPSVAPSVAGRDTAANGSTDSGDTGTNNQVTGVDEGDLVKLDGDRALVLHDSALTVVRLSPTLTTLGSVPVPDGATQLLVVGARAYVLSSGFPSFSTGSGSSGSSGGPSKRGTSTDVEPTLPVEPAMPSEPGVPVGQTGGPATTITEVAIADQPTLTDSKTVDGSVVASRRADGTVRIVTTSLSPANLGFVTPDRPASEPTALDANRRIIADSTIEDWLPSAYTKGDRQQLVPCTAVFHPVDFSGFGALTVLTMTDGLASLSATSVIANGETTYASATSLYVATTRWDQAGQGNTNSKRAANAEPATDVHRFDISVAGPAVYQGSGRVPGTVINQYAMDEADGVLRIATTRQPVFESPTSSSPCPPDAECVAPAIGIAPGGGQSSLITTLRLDGDKLSEVGHLDGLGPTETIQGVRFVGSLAYVVTFRNTDPLFVIDLTDPAAPKLLGELKTPGFSNYLHPVSDGRLLGVGVDGNEMGSSGGAKVSLYDTSDPTAPKEVAKWTSLDTSLNVGSDPHAFTWDPTTGLAILVGSWSGRPTSTDQGRYGYNYHNGAIVLRVAGDSITEVGRIARASSSPDSSDGSDAISRTFMHAGSIYAVSNQQLSSHDTASAAQTAITQL